MNYDDNALSPKVSKFHGAFSQLERMNKIWDNVNSSSIAGNFKNWNTHLDVLWMELGADCEEEGIEELSYLKFNLELKKLGVLKNNEIKGFKNSLDTQNENSESIRQLLRRKELFLRRLQNKLGKGTAWSDPDEDMIE
jgi:hypothetical protein